VEAIAGEERAKMQKEGEYFALISRIGSTRHNTG
jgi:hypothetical protein